MLVPAIPVVLQCARLLESEGQHRAVLAGLGALVGAPAGGSAAGSGGDGEEPTLAAAALERAMAQAIGGATGEASGSGSATASKPALRAEALVNMGKTCAADMLHCVCRALLALGRAAEAAGIISGAFALKVRRSRGACRTVRSFLALHSCKPPSPFAHPVLLPTESSPALSKRMAKVCSGCTSWFSSWRTRGILMACWTASSS